MVKYGIFHSTGTPESTTVTAAQIIHLHTVINGWSRPGYELLFRRSGQIEIVYPFKLDNVTEPWEWMNGMSWNDPRAVPIIKTAMQFVYEGGAVWDGKKRDAKGNPWFDGADTRTPAQKEAMTDWVFTLIRMFPEIQLLGHSDAPGQATVCPGFDFREWLRSIKVPEINIYRW